MSHVAELYGQWLRRDLSQRFAGSALGPLWLLLQPLSFIVVITLVFNGFFQAKWPGGDGSALDYGIKVFVGLSVHTFVAKTAGATVLRDETNKTHRRMLLLNDIRRITIGARTIGVAYVEVVEPPIPAYYSDVVLRKVGRYRIGLPYVAV